MNSLQDRPPNANLDSCYQTVSTLTGDNGWSHLADVVGHSVGALASFSDDCGHNKKVFCWSLNYAMQINALSILI